MTWLCSGVTGCCGYVACRASLIASPKPKNIKEETAEIFKISSVSCFATMPVAALSSSYCLTKASTPMAAWKIGSLVTVSASLAVGTLVFIAIVITRLAENFSLCPSKAKGEESVYDRYSEIV